MDLIDTIKKFLPNRGYTIHGDIRMGGTQRTYPISATIEGGALTDPTGVRHERWAVAPFEGGLIVHTDAGADQIDTGQWMVDGKLGPLPE